ncbi:unnamed protein product [Urochloa humidicola]
MRCSIAHSCTTVLLRQVGLLLATNSSSGVWSWRQCVSVHFQSMAPLAPCQSAPGLRLLSIITYQVSPQIALSTGALKQ